MTTKISRSGFLKLGAGLGAGVFANQSLYATFGSLRGPNQDYLKLPLQQGEEVVFGYYAEKDMNVVLPSAMSRLTDMKWLSPGDSVFIKVACNSGNAHPAVTAPAALEAMVVFLKSQGAGTVYAGDQSGVEQVRRTESGRVSSTKEMMQQNGLYDAIIRSGAVPYFFDDHGWDGYYEEQADFENHWNQGSVMLPRFLQDVDHIINMPRLSAHILAGYTMGIKSHIGYLRDDSRKELHQKADSFYEKYAEVVHLPIFRDKLRLTVTLVDKVLLNIGPDVGSVYELDGLCFLGSADILNHDYMGSRLLPYFYDLHGGIFDSLNPYPGLANFANKTFTKTVWGLSAGWGYVRHVPYALQPGLENDAPLSHLAVLRGHRPGTIEVKSVGDPLPVSLVNSIQNSAPEVVLT